MAMISGVNLPRVLSLLKIAVSKLLKPRIQFDNGKVFATGITLIVSASKSPISISSKNRTSKSALSMLPLKIN